MKRLIRLLLILSVVSLSLGIQAGSANADGDVLLDLTASTDNATLGDNITFTYSIVNNSNDNLTGLKVVDSQIGDINVPDLPAGGNIIFAHSYTVTLEDYSDNATVLVNTATLKSGENVLATDTLGIALNPYTASPLTRAQILKLRGVPGKGIDKAPGLQKPFNPNSQAVNNAGKKDVKGNKNKGKGN